MKTALAEGRGGNQQINKDIRSKQKEEGSWFPGKCLIIAKREDMMKIERNSSEKWEKRQKAEIVDALDMFLNHEKQAKKVPEVHNDSAGESGC